MVKNRYQNRNFGPSEGAKIQNFQRTVSLDPNGRLHKFKGHNSSNNLLKDEQNLKKRNVKKGGSNIKLRSAMVQGSPCQYISIFEMFI